MHRPATYGPSHVPGCTNPATTVQADMLWRGGPTILQGCWDVVLIDICGCQTKNAAAHTWKSLRTHLLEDNK